MALTATVQQFDAFAKKVTDDPNLFFFSPSLMKLPLKDATAEPTKYFKEDYQRILEYIKLSKFVYVIPTASASYHKILDRLKLKYNAAKPSPANQPRPDKELLTAFCQKVVPQKVIAFRKSDVWNEYVKIAQYDIKTSPFYSDITKNNNDNRNINQSDDVSTFTEDNVHPEEENHITDDGKDNISSKDAFALSQDADFPISGSHSQASNANKQDANAPDPEEKQSGNEPIQPVRPQKSKGARTESDKVESEATATVSITDNNVRRRNTTPIREQNPQRIQNHNHNTNAMTAQHQQHQTIFDITEDSPASSPQSTDSAVFDLDPFIIQPSDKAFDPAFEVNVFLAKNISYSKLKDKKSKLFRNSAVRKDALKVYNLLYYRYSTLNELSSTVNLINLYMSSRHFFRNLFSAMDKSIKAGKSLQETLQIYNEERRIGFIAFLDNIIMTGISFNMLYAMNFHALFEDIKSANDTRSVIDIIFAVFFYGRNKKEKLSFWWKWIVPKLLERTNQLKTDRILDRKGNQMKQWNSPHFENRIIYHSVKYFKKRKSDQLRPFDVVFEQNSHGRKRQKEFHRSILSNSPPSPIHFESHDLEPNPHQNSDYEAKQANNNRLEQQRLVFDEKLNKVTNDMNAKMDRMAHNLNNSGSRYAFSRYDSPQKKLITLESHAISALTVDRTQDKEAAVYLADAVANEETRTHEEIIMDIMQRKMNGNKRADTASNKELITKVEGLHL